MFYPNLLLLLFCVVSNAEDVYCVAKGYTCEEGFLMDLDQSTNVTLCTILQLSTNFSAKTECFINSFPLHIPLIHALDSFELAFDSNVFYNEGGIEIDSNSITLSGIPNFYDIYSLSDSTGFGTLTIAEALELSEETLKLIEFNSEIKVALNGIKFNNISFQAPLSKIQFNGNVEMSGSSSLRCFELTVMDNVNMTLFDESTVLFNQSAFPRETAINDYLVLNGNSRFIHSGNTMKPTNTFIFNFVTLNDFALLSFEHLVKSLIQIELNDHSFASFGTQVCFGTFKPILITRNESKIIFKSMACLTEANLFGKSKASFTQGVSVVSNPKVSLYEESSVDFVCVGMATYLSSLILQGNSSVLFHSSISETPINPIFSIGTIEMYHKSTLDCVFPMLNVSKLMVCGESVVHLKNEFVMNVVSATFNESSQIIFENSSRVMMVGTDDSSGDGEIPSLSLLRNSKISIKSALIKNNVSLVNETQAICSNILVDSTIQIETDGNNFVFISLDGTLNCTVCLNSHQELLLEDVNKIVYHRAAEDSSNAQMLSILLLPFLILFI